MSLQCGNNLAGIAELCVKKYPVTVYKSMLLLAPGFTIPTLNDLADYATMVGYVAAGNIYPIQGLVNATPEDTEGNTEETSTQEKIHNYDGLRGSMYDVTLPLESHKIARTYNDINWTIIYVDRNGTIICSKNDDGTYQGVSTNLFQVKPLPTPSAEGSTKTMIQVQEADIDDIDKNGWYLNPTWNAKKLYGPLLVQISSTAVASFEWVSTVLYQSDGRADSDGNPESETAIASGLLAADFVVIDQDGATLASATDYTVTESTAGVYAFNATVGAMTSGTIQVKTTAAPLLKSLTETLTA